MSISHSATPRNAPFLSVDEQVFFVPPRGTMVSNRSRKLLFFFEAHCLHYVAGQEINTRVQLGAGDILIVPAVCSQQYGALQQDTTRVHALRLVLDPALVPPLALGQPEQSAGPAWEETGDDATTFAARHLTRYTHLAGGMNAEVRETLARMRREADAANQVGSVLGHELRVGAACQDLLVLVARQLQQKLDTRAVRVGHGAFKVEEVRDYVMRHLESPLSLESIGQHLQLSPEHLARQWKKHTGTTLFGFLRRARVDRAKTLLTATDLNISQIGQACGFSSLALFSRTFKQETGFAPGQYRERLVEGLRR